jgi:ketosteroid isomerase-like protein
MSHREQALEFLRRFAAGDINGLEPLLAEDLRLSGPYLQVESRAAYLRALRSAPPEPGGLHVLSVTDDGDAVAVFYDYEKRGAVRTVAQLFRFSDGRIREMRLVFDGRESA